MRYVKILWIALLTTLLNGAAVAQSGGELLVKEKRDQATLNSNRFRCSSCATRVVEALKKERGVTEVRVEGEKPPINVVVRFDPRKTNARRIGRAAKRALETDPHDRFSVKLRYEEEGR
ncbi:MAG: hypothetical protein C4334_03930 [Pyrinomonas sp.]|uniref:heavy-metal-associated domain-containing protein n=1 Tax=Pyrinomonas sp. TaxID=2080306 RepID=UPI003327A0D7